MNEFIILMKNELVVTAIIFILLFIKIGSSWKNDTLLPVIQVLLLANLLSGFFFNDTGNLFGDMFHTNPLIVMQKNILSAAVYLISLVAGDWFRKSNHLAEFFILMLSSLLGMFLLISSGNFLMFFLALELSSIPVAAMANFDLHQKRSSEGAMKLILSSAFSSGILLFGISLLYGATGTVSFDGVNKHLENIPLLVFAFVLIFTSFAFKLSIVPFHLWTADVYEGAPVATTAYLSVVSKGAVAFILLTALYKVFVPLQEIWFWLLVALALTSMVIGNLFAMRQQNMKRFLAFSSIAQVGFILAGMSSYSYVGIASVVYFILVYVFSNIAAFGVVSVIAEQTGRENIDDYRGLYRTNPLLTWVMALAMFSLAGIPPTAGFFGKFFLLSSAGSKADYWFIIIAALNMIVSLYYYLRVVRSMFMETQEHPVPALPVHRTVKLGLLLCAAGIVLAGVLSWLYDHIQNLAMHQ